MTNEVILLTLAGLVVLFILIGVLGKTTEGYSYGNSYGRCMVDCYGLTPSDGYTPQLEKMCQWKCGNPTY